MAKTDVLYARLLANSVDLGKDGLRPLQDAAAEHGVVVVVGCATALEVADIPADIPYRDALFSDADEWINPGDAVIYKPFGGLAAGPMHCDKGLLMAEIDPAAVQASRRKFDATGHYSRPDVFALTVNRARQAPVSFTNR